MAVIIGVGEDSRHFSYYLTESIGCNPLAPGTPAPALEKAVTGIVGYNLAKRIYPTVYTEMIVFSSSEIRKIEAPDAGMRGHGSAVILLCLRK